MLKFQYCYFSLVSPSLISVELFPNVFQVVGTFLKYDVDIRYILLWYVWGQNNGPKDIHVFIPSLWIHWILWSRGIKIADGIKIDNQ